MSKLSIFAAGSIVAALLEATVAQAADAGAPSAARSWTGCYVGANAGYTRADVDATDAPFRDGPFGGSGISWNSAGAPYETIGMDDGGLSGGLEAGCDYQFDLGGTAFVLGGVADFSLMNLGDTGTSAISADTHTGFDVDWAASARLRAGIAASDLLFYVTGGYALADVDVRAYDRTGATRMDVKGGGTEGGWVAGGGVEWRFKPDWSVGLEYLHYDFGTVTATGPATFPADANPRFDNDVSFDAIRIGLKWRM
ncbi:outer membrane beta-barrel protein [Rhizobium sp. TRM96647]|uniref:outer membrane protein n=1 Tax=Rhizobium sp. TRM96647 TaxID=2979861 RepID=UPI0021E8DEBA|nr:outer membrane beta-barrel protein [Rhizobium sp. TRM96647]MCV3737933.1 outer membrane beta-barrel protein [Rhizobium sp. TRM96647]